MAAEVDVQSLLWALSILAVPLLAAIPLRFIWQYWIGVGHEETEYRTTVRQIIDSGRQLESYRNSLNDVARSLRLPPSRQRLIEADILNPLSISHFPHSSGSDHLSPCIHRSTSRYDRWPPSYPCG